MSAEVYVVAAIAVALVGAATTPLTSRCKTTTGIVALVMTIASAGLVLAAVSQVLLHGPSPAPEAFWAMPRLGFALRLHVDGLSALFLALAAAISVPTALYSVVYMRRYADCGVGSYYPYVLLFLAAMYGLVSTTDMMWFFFIFWQMMTIPGFLLIRYERREAANRRAAARFLVMMQIACVVTMVGAEMLAVTGARVSHADGLKYDFATVSANLPLLLPQSPVWTAVAFGLFLVGFGIKMGMWPFGRVWLPDAHPAAPSPVSAMLSGVMIKTGVYGLLRYFIWLVPERALGDYPLAAWGALVTVIGAATLLSGTYEALRQEQSKRLLAFHSIGQVGYILLGTGACMALLAAGGPTFSSEGAPVQSSLAALALMGAVLHVLNHGVFKALLFLNAGTILNATDTQDLNRLGGLRRFMPVTALTALIASCSIAGVPLFSGFTSKWAIYVASVQGSAHAGYLALCGVLAILTSALTLASFVKFYGTAFLTRTSALVAERAAASTGSATGSASTGSATGGCLDGHWTMQAPQAFLALICVVVGLAPAGAMALVWRGLATSADGLGAVLIRSKPLAASATLGVARPDGTAALMPVAIMAALGACMALLWWLSRLGGSRRRADEPWLCGYATDAECHRYSAHSFYGEVKGLLGRAGRTLATSGSARSGRAQRRLGGSRALPDEVSAGDRREGTSSDGAS